MKNMKKSLYITDPSLRPPCLCAKLVFSAELRNESRRGAEGAEKNFAEMQNKGNGGVAAFPPPGRGEYDGSRTGIEQTSESRSIKVNQAQSRWIKANNIVFENKLAGRPRWHASRLGRTARSGPVANA